MEVSQILRIEVSSVRQKSKKNRFTHIYQKTTVIFQTNFIIPTIF